ncbi:MAG: 2-phospho-L-lactate guanylyltransferase [Bacteroidia bacterium]|nr:2-phospho-L-lactate guanylyltransferase [Bacteroidia bacterium]
MNELIFEVTQDGNGYTAECLTEAIFTQGDSWEDLRKNVQDAVAGFFFDSTEVRPIRLHLVRDELVLA